MFGAVAKRGREEDDTSDYGAYGIKVRPDSSTAPVALKSIL